MTTISATVAYVELPVRDSEASAIFFERAFGWELTRFGPTYAGTMGRGADLGLQGDATEAPAAPLAGIRVKDLDAALAAVEAAGGMITQPIFAFPGGRRFHFREPGGNELSVFADD
ncbi:VOC family protein [Sphingobium nicotianae]|uniref:VOC family protein n=1 Tax=Sphingobium nicotianae TaxID=2782607 RepID=A0A9X1DGE3_9SPHN|nr:VOC family protein [Sphingobium nicotianae]MBT2189383.1 VOC family protein [Sphingobium nicotianae]